MGISSTGAGTVRVRSDGGAGNLLCTALAAGSTGWGRQQLMPVRQAHAGPPEGDAPPATPSKQGIANEIWRLAKLHEDGVDVSVDVKLQLDQLVGKLFETSKPKDFANMLWSLGKMLEVAPDVLVRPDVLARLVAGLEPMAEAEPQAIASVLWTLAKLHQGGVDVALPTGWSG